MRDVTFTPEADAQLAADLELRKEKGWLEGNIHSLAYTVERRTRKSGSVIATRRELEMWLVQAKEHRAVAALYRVDLFAKAETLVQDIEDAINNLAGG